MEMFSRRNWFCSCFIYQGLAVFPGLVLNLWVQGIHFNLLASWDCRHTPLQMVCFHCILILCRIWFRSSAFPELVKNSLSHSFKPVFTCHVPPTLEFVLIVFLGLIHIRGTNFILLLSKINDEERRAEQRKYGVFFDDDYDYLQHLKEPSGPSELIPASTFLSSRDEKEETSVIPVSLFSNSRIRPWMWERVKKPLVVLKQDNCFKQKIVSIWRAQIGCISI